MHTGHPRASFGVMSFFWLGTSWLWMSCHSSWIFHAPPPPSPFQSSPLACAPFWLLFCFHGKLLASYVNNVAGGNSWFSWMYTSGMNQKCSKSFPSESKTKACMHPTRNSIYFPSMVVTLTDGSPVRKVWQHCMCTVVEREFHAFSKFRLATWTRKPFRTW